MIITFTHPYTHQATRTALIFIIFIWAFTLASSNKSAQAHSYTDPFDGDPPVCKTKPNLPQCFPSY